LTSRFVADVSCDLSFLKKQKNYIKYIITDNTCPDVSFILFSNRLSATTLKSFGYVRFNIFYFLFLFSNRLSLIIFELSLITMYKRHALVVIDVSFNFILFLILDIIVLIR